MIDVLDVLNRRISRRAFLKVSAVAGGTVAASSLFTTAALAGPGEVDPDPLSGANVKYLRTCCMMCNSACGIQVKVVDGIAEKIEGNPYAFLNSDIMTAGEVVPSVIANPHLKGSRICAKGNAGLMTLYSPFRLLYPLKRDGARGSGMFKKIGWKEAVNSIAYGYTDSAGANLATLPKSDGVSTYNIRDAGASLAQIMDPDQVGVVAPTEPNVSPMPTADKYDAGLPIVYGYAANRLVTTAGRDQWGTPSYFKASIGTVNEISHESLCNNGWKISWDHMGTGSYGYKASLQPGGAGAKYYICLGAAFNEAWVPHVPLARWTADFKRRTDTKLVLTDVRVSQSTAKSSDNPNVTRLVPKGGTDGAFCNGILARWLANYIGGTATAIAAGFLKSVNSASVVALDSRPTYGADGAYVTDAAQLVDTATGLKRGASTAAREYCDATTQAEVAFNQGTAGAPVAQADVELYPGVSTGGYKTVFRLIVEALAKIGGWDGVTPANPTATELNAAVAALATECGIAQATINAIADDAQTYGGGSGGANKGKLAVDGYRGIHAHTNGYAGMRALWALNAFQDTFNRMGGVVRGSSQGAGSVGALVAPPAGSGVKIDRSTSGYSEDATTPYGTAGQDYYTLANPRGTGQLRRWFPRTKRGVEQDIGPAAAQGYPYKVKAMLFTAGGNLVYCTPLGNGAVNSTADMLKKVDGSGVYKTPVLIYITTCMDETAAHSDFILPGTTYFERWAANLRHHGYGGTMSQHGVVRRPVVNWYKDVTIDGRATRVSGSPLASLDTFTSGTHDAYLDDWSGPMIEDDMFIALGKKLGRPQYGNGAGAGALTGGLAYDSSYAWHNKLLTGGSWSGLQNDGDPTLYPHPTKGVGYGCAHDFAEASGNATVTAKGLLFIGGQFKDSTALEGTTGWALNGQGGRYYLYLQQNIVNQYGTAATPSAVVALPIRELNGMDLDNVAANTDPDYDLTLHTYKAAWQVQSRSTENVWLANLTGPDRNAAGTEPDSPGGKPTVWIHPTRAAERGITPGILVKVTSATNTDGVMGYAQVTNCVQENAVVIDHHYGRGWFGSGLSISGGSSGNYKDWTVGGANFTPDIADEVLIGDPPLRHNDVVLGVKSGDHASSIVDLGLTCRISGQAGFNSGKVKVEPA